MAFPCRIIGIDSKDTHDPETAELKWFKSKEIPWENTLLGNRELIDRLS